MLPSRDMVTLSNRYGASGAFVDNIATETYEPIQATFSPTAIPWPRVVLMKSVELVDSKRF